MKNKDISSRRAAELQKYKKMVEAIPDVRQEKVEAIRKQIEVGKYKVPAKSVAGSIAELHHILTSKKDDEDGMADE